MSTHVPGFQSFFGIFASFYIGQISHLIGLISSKLQINIIIIYITLKYLQTFYEFCKKK